MKIQNWIHNQMFNYRKNKELFFKILKNTYEAVHNIITRHCLAYLHP